MVAAGCPIYHERGGVLDQAKGQLSSSAGLEIKMEAIVSLSKASVGRVIVLVDSSGPR